MSLATMAFGMVFLLWILAILFGKGMAALGPALFTQMTPPPGSDGGLANAIVGSLIIVSAAIFIATPVGILAGIYLAEIGRNSTIAKVTRFINDILLSAPSIVIGLFVYTLIVANAKHYSAWAGAVALAIIAVPVIVRQTENMLQLVPNSLREAAVALGAPQWRVVLIVTLRAVKGGVVTGVLLALARISGETAPLLFTALNNQFWSTDLNAPMANLPVVIFQFAMSPYEEWQRLAWAGALLITLAVLLLNIVARSLFRQTKH
ncbi:MAG: phosphate ABC transporter permease PstA [Burkholderiales bacterium]|jgi:phosphate transport system permease protein|nr:phosphate ABC transporter permease PstA [Casimicrobium huifangae]